jgi:Flp pilus assembly protein TadG
MNKILVKFKSCRKAAAALEMALVMPLLILLSIGSFELIRYVLIQQKVSKTVTSMSDLVARSPSLSENDMTVMFTAVSHLMEPYAFGSNGRVIISSVSNNGTNVRVRWQRAGGGTLTAVSKIGTAGNTATLPAGFTLATNEDTIVSEVFYNFQPVVAPDVVGAQVMYKVKYNKPRFGALTTISP